jgi:Protein of unknown function (DUF2911)
MKKLLFVASFSIAAALARAQTELPQVDKSPMDMSYYPANYPVLKIQDKPTGPLVARVIYSRPKKEGRTIFGGLVEYGKIWRLGANEATEIEFYRKVNIGGKKVARGRYTLYAIVNEYNWTFILNKMTDTWGAFKYDSSKDVIRVVVPVEKTNVALENFAMMFEKADTNLNDTNINLVVAWDTVRLSLPIKL